MLNPYVKAEAVILALDPAKGKSGASILRPSGQRTKLVHAGVVTKQSEREGYVIGAKNLAETAKLPLIIVAEEWDPPRGCGPTRVDTNWNYPTILGIGEGWGRWTAEFERCDISGKDVVRVTPNTWRDALYGKKRERDSLKLKQLAVEYVMHKFHVNLPHDAAESVCLGLWGEYSTEVLTLVEKWFKNNKKTPT